MTFAHLGHPGIRQPNSVDHAAVELGDPRRWRAGSGLQAHRLRDDPTQPIEVDHLVELFTVRRRAGGEQNGVLEPHVAERDSEPVAWRSSERLAHWLTAFARRW